MARRKQRFPRAARSAAEAAYMVSTTMFPAKVVEKQLRKTLAFWCYFDNLDVSRNTPLSEVKRFARIFRARLEANRHRGQVTDDFDVRSFHVDRAALEAVREWAMPQAPPESEAARRMAVRETFRQQDVIEIGGVDLLPDEEQELYRALREDWRSRSDL